MPLSQTAPNYFGLAVVAFAAVLLIRGGCQTTRPDPVTPGPVQPDDPKPVNPEQPEAGDVWGALALCVERQTFGVLQQHTDHIVAIADMLKSTGTLSDTARVDQWRAKRIEITDANRAAIVATLRGQQQ